MSSQTLAMQGAIVDALKAYAPLNQILQKRVYDRVPEGVALPYISIGPSQLTQDDFDCTDGAEVFQQVDVWSKEPGYTECKKIGALVRQALHRLTVTRDGFTFQIEHRFTTEQRDGDGITSHGVLSFRALIDMEAL